MVLEIYGSRYHMTIFFFIHSSSNARDGRMVTKAKKDERFQLKKWNKEKDSIGEVRPTLIGRRCYSC